MYTAQGRADVEAGYRAAKRSLQSIPLDKPQRPLRVGILGEFYTVMDAFSNLELEQKLADMGVERSEDLCFYALCVVRSPVAESTVNLRCPVAINDHTHRAMQVILEDGSCPPRQPRSAVGA